MDGTLLSLPLLGGHRPGQRGTGGPIGNHRELVLCANGLDELADAAGLLRGDPPGTSQTRTIFAAKRVINGRLTLKDGRKSPPR